MKKSIISLFLILTCIVSLASGCTQKSKQVDTQNPSNIQAVVQNT